jgi:hypothetical protein
MSESNTSSASLLADGDFELVEFAIPTHELKKLRFDPMTNPGSFWIRSMYMRSGYSKIPISFAKLTGSAKILKNEICDGLLYV